MSTQEFKSPAKFYDRFMGRYTESLAPKLADVADVGDGSKVVDIGCGPGGLTVELARRTAESNIAAIDPGELFTEACQERVPGADVRTGIAEELPWEDASFDAALACLVVAFMNDPDKGIAEMARVTRPGGKIAACMWDTAGGGMPMLGLTWKALHAVTGEANRDQKRAGTAEGDIAERFERIGLQDVVSGTLTAHVDYPDFEDFWEPMTHGVGPAGQALGKLDDATRHKVRDELRTLVPDGAFTLEGRAWYAVGTVA
ncbi:MAG: class I SAM-dependent methyltransferase [Solirubrobacterales bacterium]